MGETKKPAAAKPRAISKKLSSDPMASVKIGRLQRAWQQMPQIAGAAALITGGLFFVGWQYKQSLAMAFGLSGYPGDMSFQSTVATGVTVFNTFNTFLVIGAFWGAFVAINFVRAIPDFISAWSTRVSDRLEELGVKTENLKQLSVENPSVLGTDDFTKELDAAFAESKNVSRERKILRAVLNSTIAMALIMMASSVVLVGTGIILLFKTGNSIAVNDAKAIRAEARGRCDGCFLYHTKSDNLLGVPVFQSTDAIYVQEYAELYRVQLSDLRSIKSYWRTTDKPLTDPRR